MLTQKYINDMAYEIIGCAIEVHKELGPGLLESIYEECICEELTLKKFSFTRQMFVPVIYKNWELNIDLRLDVLVENLIVCELKAIEVLLPVHSAQVLSYMKLLQKPKGLLINFHTDNVARAYKPFVNDIFAGLPAD